MFHPSSFLFHKLTPAYFIPRNIHTRLSCCCPPTAFNTPFTARRTPAAIYPSALPLKKEEKGMAFAFWTEEHCGVPPQRNDIWFE